MLGINNHGEISTVQQQQKPIKNCLKRNNIRFNHQFFQHTHTHTYYSNEREKKEWIKTAVDSFRKLAVWDFHALDAILQYRLYQTATISQ